MVRESDDINKRKKYKKECFGNKKSTRDEYTDERIFSGNRKDASRRHPTEKTADIDHITPIDKIDQRYKNWTPEQRKELANMERNYAVTNSKLNRSKGNRENHEYLIREFKKGQSADWDTTINMLGLEVQSRTAIRCKATMQKVPEAPKAGVYAVKNAEVELLMITITNVVDVVNENKDTSDAVGDVVGATAGIYAAGAMDQLLTGGAGGVQKVIAVASVMKDSFMKYLNDEIDGQQFVEEAALQGVQLLAGNIAYVVSGGNILVSMIASYACSMICNEIVKIRDSYKSIKSMQTEYLSRLNRVMNEMIQELHVQRENLRVALQKEQLTWSQAIDTGFEQIFEGALNYDIQTVSSGLDTIMELFGTEVVFKNTNNVRSFFNQDNRVFSL